MRSDPEIWKEFFETYYQDEVNRLALRIRDNGSGDKSLFINFTDISIFRHEIAEELLEYPAEVLAHAEKGLEITDNSQGIDLSGAHPRIINLPIPRKIDIRNLRSGHIGKLIAVEGIVRKITEVRPKIILGAFRCPEGHINYVEQNGGKLREPHECIECRRKGPFYLIPEKSITADSQRVKIQEYPENLKGGEQPQTLDVILHDDLTGVINPGDRVIINGILMANVRKVSHQKTPVMDIILEGNSIEILEQEYEELEITKEDEEAILSLKEDPHIFDKIVRSISPSIYGYEEVKKSIALQLFSGLPKVLPDGTRIRGDIHVLLVGDPGVAKSQLLRYVHRIAPRGVYTTGKGTTYAGLTATAVKDEFDGRWTLEAGALVMADKGIALIDEIDKMRTDDVGALHEVMEQQTVSVAKAGINAILKARCAILAAANPKYGRFDKYVPIGDQINLSPSLLSRFDLIFTLTDDPDEYRDRDIATHILNSHYVGEILQKMNSLVTTEYSQDYVDSRSRPIMPEIDPELLRKYIAYAKRMVFPVLSEEAKERIIEFYVSMRNSVKDAKSAIPITARQLEALVRLAEASARVRLSDIITIEDAENVIQIVRKCLSQIALDPETQQIDIDILAVGTPKSQRDRIITIKGIIRELDQELSIELGKSYRGVPEEEIFRRAEDHGVPRERTREILSRLNKDGEVYTPHPGHYRPIER
jgi:replicative DNA helicase Mcm